MTFCFQIAIYSYRKEFAQRGENSYLKKIILVRRRQKDKRSPPRKCIILSNWFGLIPGSVQDRNKTVSHLYLLSILNVQHLYKYSQCHVAVDKLRPQLSNRDVFRTLTFKKGILIDFFLFLSLRQFKIINLEYCESAIAHLSV